MTGKHKADGLPAAETLEPLPAPEPETAPLAPGWREDTITSFPAIRDDTPPPAVSLPDDATEPVFVSDLTQPCPCGSGKTLLGCDGRPSPAIPVPAETRTLLSCAPGVVSRMWRTRVANGQWENLPALADQAHARIMMPALDRQRAIRGEVAARRHDIAAMLTRSPSLLADRVLSDGLRDLELRLAERLADMQAEAEEREAAA